MSPRKPPLAIEESPDLSRPLRLRRRRDGSMCLINHVGVVGADDRRFPSPHIFNYRWLAMEGAEMVRMVDDEVHLDLANAKATYRVVRHTTVKDDGVEGVLCELVATELFDAPPVDEAAAERIARRRAKDQEA